MKLDATGQMYWTQALGDIYYPQELGLGISTDGRGSVYVSGEIEGVGGPNATDGTGGLFDDAFVAKVSDAPEPSSHMLMIVGAVILCARRSATDNCEPEHRLAASVKSGTQLPLPSRPRGCDI